MTRIIVHAGYHKTGTTGLQDFLADNRKTLAPYLRYYGKADFLNAGAAARIYAQRPFPWRLGRFRRHFRSFLAAVPEGGTIVLSRETFSGGMPGHRRAGGALMTSYHGPALMLARVVIDELRRRFGHEAEIVFFYTTRDREAWIRSVYGHLLRSIRMTDDFAAFRARFPALASPAEEAARMRGALAPVPVVTAALDKFATHREGPAAVLLDLIGVPDSVRADLLPAKRGNPGQDAAVRDALLALNRRRLSKSALRRAKRDLLHRHESG